MKTIGEKINKLRKQRGLSQEELAFEIGVSRQTVSKWESNLMQPTIDNIRFLCDFFKVSPEYFIGEDSAHAETVASDAGLPTVTEAVSTEPIGNDSETDTKPIKKGRYSKKKIALMTFLISLSSVVFVIGAFFGGIEIYNLTLPSIGVDDHAATYVNAFAIVGIILAVAALSAAIVLIVLLVRNKKQNRK